MDELIKVKSPKIKEEEAEERDRKKANNNDNKQRDIIHRQFASRNMRETTNYYKTKSHITQTHDA